MPDYPAAGVLSNAANTIVEQKGYVENDAEAGRRALGGGALEFLTVAANAISLGISSTIAISGSSQDLNTINDGTFPSRDGHVITLVNLSATIYTLGHLKSGGNIRLRGQVDYILPAQQSIMLYKRLTDWEEIGRGELLPDAMQAFLELKDGAYATQGVGGDLDATTLQGFSPASFLAVGATADNALLFKSEDSPSFVQTTLSSLSEVGAIQTIATSLRMDNGDLVMNRAAGTVGIEFQRASIKRAILNQDGDNVDMQLLDTSGATVDATFRFKPDGDLQAEVGAGAGFKSITTAVVDDYIADYVGSAYSGINDKIVEVSSLVVPWTGLVRFDQGGWMGPGNSQTLVTRCRFGASGTTADRLMWLYVIDGDDHTWVPLGGWLDATHPPGSFGVAGKAPGPVGFHSDGTGNALSYYVKATAGDVVTFWIDQGNGGTGILGGSAWYNSVTLIREA